MIARGMHECAFSPCVAHIDLERLRRNLRRLCDTPRSVMPVIKSDAYGHGLLPVARTLVAEGVTHLAVGTMDEGVCLRRGGVTQSIVVLLGAHSAKDIARAVDFGLTLLLYSAESLAWAVAQAGPNRLLDVAIKCDTGMARLGFTAGELPALLEALRAAPWLRPVLAISHLACADMPEKDAFSRQQAATFDAMYTTLSGVFPGLLRSLCNSAGALAYPQWAGHLLRPGLALYGGNPLHGTAWANLGASLEQVMSVRAPILQVRHLAPGEPASYGSLFVAQRASRLAVLGMGYADGFPRTLSCRGEVFVGDLRAPLCARVCMGMMLADVTDIDPEKTRPGDWAWIMGGPPHAHTVTLQELADVWGTIPYEVQCLLGRNTRIYA